MCKIIIIKCMLVLAWTIATATSTTAYATTTSITNTLTAKSCCDSKPCLNGATCTDLADGGCYCTCPPSFSGYTCQLAPCCAPSPCQNGGLCMNTDVFDKCNCICLNGFSGLNCTVEPKLTTTSPITTMHAALTSVAENCCANEPCANGATCNNFMGYCSCICADGFFGPRCEFANCCFDHEKCKNGGTCVLETDGRCGCICYNDFYGDNCTIPATTSSLKTTTTSTLTTTTTSTSFKTIFTSITSSPNSTSSITTITTTTTLQTPSSTSACLNSLCCDKSPKNCEIFANRATCTLNYELNGDPMPNACCKSCADVKPLPPACLDSTCCDRNPISCAMIAQSASCTPIFEMHGVPMPKACCKSCTLKLASFTTTANMNPFIGSSSLASTCLNSNCCDRNPTSCPIFAKGATCTLNYELNGVAMPKACCKSCKLKE